jgi:hypothetical protein
LDFNGAVHCVDDTPELDNCAIAGALDDSTVVYGDGRIDQVASERPQPRQNPVLVSSGKPRIADYVSFGVGSECRSARQLFELSERGGVKLKSRFTRLMNTPASTPRCIELIFVSSEGIKAIAEGRPRATRAATTN